MSVPTFWLRPLSAAAMLIAVIACGQPEGSEVSKVEFERSGLVWPLTVQQGRVGCSGLETWFEWNGTKYGLNGFATPAKGYRELEIIWLTADPGPRANLGDLMSVADEQCKA